MKTRIPILPVLTAFSLATGCQTNSPTERVGAQPVFLPPAQPATIPPKTPVPAAEIRDVPRPPQPQASIRAVLIVQNHVGNDADIPLLALTDTLTTALSKGGIRIVNPYNAVGVGQNRRSSGEVTPETSALELARTFGAEAVATASIAEFLDTKIGDPALFHQYTVRLALNLADTATGGTICGVLVKKASPKYTNSQVASSRQAYFGELLHSAAEESAEKLLADPALVGWHPAPLPPPPSPSNPNLTVSDIDDAVQDLFGKMRLNPVFRTNYDEAQGRLGRAPTAILGGIADMTGGNSPCDNLPDLLAVASQGMRMAFVNSGLFDAKDDALVSAMTKRIIESGNSPLEDGELMASLKQHGSPDFYVVGDMMFFTDGNGENYRLRLALHNLHTGKIAWEGVSMIAKPTAH